MTLAEQAIVESVAFEHMAFRRQSRWTIEQCIVELQGCFFLIGIAPKGRIDGWDDVCCLYEIAYLALRGGKI